MDLTPIDIIVLHEPGQEMVTVSSETLASLAERIVDLANPHQVILFGSHARGTANGEFRH